MKKLLNKLSAVILMFAFLFLINQFANGQVNPQPCKDSYNRALALYNRGQFARINNDLAGCVNAFNTNKPLYKNEPNKTMVFKVYKLMISSYEKLKQGGLGLKKKYELFAFYAPTPANQLEITLTNTKLEAIR